MKWKNSLIKYDKVTKKKMPNFCLIRLIQINWIESKQKANNILFFQNASNKQVLNEVLLGGRKTTKWRSMKRLELIRERFHFYVFVSEITTYIRKSKITGATKWKAVKKIYRNAWQNSRFRAANENLCIWSDIHVHVHGSMDSQW